MYLWLFSPCILRFKGIISSHSYCTPDSVYQHHSKYFNQRKSLINRQKNSLKLPYMIANLLCQNLFHKQTLDLI